jgi:hypothetical protein
VASTTRSTRRSPALHNKPGTASPPARAILQFLPGWLESASGEMQPGGRLLIEYDPERLRPSPCLSRGVPPWELCAQVRFHPRGRDYGRSLFQMWDQEGETKLRRPHPWAHELEIPYDATHLEIWFRMTDAQGCTDWDSRFGENYWFELTTSPGEAPTIPVESVFHRPGANPSPEMINVFSERALKRRVGDSPHSLSVETRLFVRAWTRSSSLASAAAWADVHIFDEDDELIHFETFPLEQREPAGGDGEFFVLDRPVYEGSSLVPAGSVARSRDREARKLQYRLYFQAHGRLFTDGLLHQHDLSEDAASH